MTKKELLAELKGKGIDADPKLTNKQLETLLGENTKVKVKRVKPAKDLENYNNGDALLAVVEAFDKAIEAESSTSLRASLRREKAKVNQLYKKRYA